MRPVDYVVAAAFCVAMALAVNAAGQITGPRASPLTIDSMYGPDLFQFYCAACHGKDGKGNGPVARMLKDAPADLTLIAKRNDGVFPKSRVESYVTGDAPGAEAHGSKDMPVWGPIFRFLDPSDLKVKIRIANIVAHLESMQMK
jgi:mono/diheme cytochrome c family protein